MLDLTRDLPDLLLDIVNIESVSGNEKDLADQVEAALRAQPHLEVRRDQDAVVARTQAGRGSRVVIAGHLDTVPVANNVPGRMDAGMRGGQVWGRGAVDMKGGIAVMLSLAAKLAIPTRDITWVFYDHEEVESSLNGLGRIAREHADWLDGQFAVLMEPTSATVEGGCQGTIRVRLAAQGVASHSARSWLGKNAIHALRPALDLLTDFPIIDVEVDGLTYREAINATAVGGGIAGNVIPDRAFLDVNYRFAPHRSTDEALARVHEWFAGFDIEVLDVSPGARPGLDRPAAKEFIAAVGATPRAKYGWTDVARFSELGIPAVNFGPGDPGKCHADDEACEVADLHACADALRRWLSA